ncbi:DNA alkylation repair protein [Candidatus Bathyarchaeota archaeon]|nr:DNA alkylation repair protein [Candidatus Bathyarchaeota archaeon]
MDVTSIITRLETLSDPSSVKSMKRVGITPVKSFGVRIPDLRALAKEIGKNHDLALKLWQVDYRETRILASMIDDLERVDDAQMEHWVDDFTYWEICDQVIMNLFGRHPIAWKKALEWSKREKEYTKRAGYVIMARLAVTEKGAPDVKFEDFYHSIVVGARDERSMVKKAVSWALRQIGKRNRALNLSAIKVAKSILESEDDNALWVAKDVLKELQSQKIQERLQSKT